MGPVTESLGPSQCQRLPLPICIRICRAPLRPGYGVMLGLNPPSRSSTGLEHVGVPEYSAFMVYATPVARRSGLFRSWALKGNKCIVIYHHQVIHQIESQLKSYGPKVDVKGTAVPVARGVGVNSSALPLVPIYP